MNIKNDIARMTIDIPQKTHTQLKTLSALLGKSMKELVIESIDGYIHNLKTPNKTTIKAIKETENGKGLVEADSLADLFKKLGI